MVLILLFQGAVLYLTFINVGVTLRSDSSTATRYKRTHFHYIMDVIEQR